MASKQTLSDSAHAPNSQSSQSSQSNQSQQSQQPMNQAQPGQSLPSAPLGFSLRDLPNGRLAPAPVRPQESTTQSAQSKNPNTAKPKSAMPVSNVRLSNMLPPGERKTWKAHLHPSGNEIVTYEIPRCPGGQDPQIWEFAHKHLNGDMQQAELTMKRGWNGKFVLEGKVMPIYDENSTQERRNEDHIKIMRLEQELNTLKSAFNDLKKSNTELQQFVAQFINTNQSKLNDIERLDTDIETLFDGCDKLATWSGFEKLNAVQPKPGPATQSQPLQSVQSPQFGNQQSQQGQVPPQLQSPFSMSSTASAGAATPAPGRNQPGTQFNPYQAQPQSTYGAQHETAPPSAFGAASMQPPPPMQSPAQYQGVPPQFNQSGTGGPMAPGQGQPQGYSSGQNYPPFAGQWNYGSSGAFGGGFSHGYQGPR